MAAIPGTSFPILPDEDMTPGAVMTTDVNVICHRSTKTVRNVTMQEKIDVYHAYEAKYHVHYPTPHGKFAEVDHLISLELGGSNDEKNLWPQPWHLTNDQGQDVGAHTKDKLENELHRRICLPQSNPDWLPVQRAQDQIAGNWINAYEEYIGPLPNARR